jgi:predicted dehydrogenase
MTAAPIRVGVVGAGANTIKFHIPLLQAQEGVEIVCVCNRSEASSRRVAEQFGIARIAASWTDVVADPEVDAVVIGTWPYTHKVMVIAALQHGKHVMTEARMAMDASEAHEMLAESQRHPQQVCQVVPSPFTLKWDATIQRLLQEGTIGELLAVRINSAAPGLINRERDIMWRDQLQYSGLNTMGMGIFWEAVRRWVGDATSVVAMAETFVRTRHNPAIGRAEAIRIPDHIDVLAKLACGAQLSMTVSGVMPGESFFLLQGSEGSIKVSITDGSLCLNGQEVTVPSEEQVRCAARQRKGGGGVRWMM